MNKRDFIKSSILAGAGLASFSSAHAHETSKPEKSGELKHWVWENPRKEEEEKAPPTRTFLSFPLCPRKEMRDKLRSR